MRWNQASSLNTRSVRYISPYAPHEGTSSHNSLLIHNLCPAVREPQLSYMDANAAVSLHFVLLMHTPVCCANRATIFLEKYPIYHQFRQLSLARVFCVFSSCLEWKLSSKFFHVLVNCCRVWKTPMRKVSSEFTTTLPVESVFDILHRKADSRPQTYSRSNSTNSPASGAGNFSEPRLMS
jgi:hypothetical protein